MTEGTKRTIRLPCVPEAAIREGRNHYGRLALPMMSWKGGDGADYRPVVPEMVDEEEQQRREGAKKKGN